MTEERRSSERVNVKLHVRWNGGSGRHEARVEDISLGGCFVSSIGRVDLDEVITLEIEMPDGCLLLHGKVASFQPGIGFGLMFASLTDEEEDKLRQLVQLFTESRGSE